MSEPLLFVFGLHLHQPVGNFDYVFAQHLRDVYRPILERAAAARMGPLTVHVSGPLFDWLEQHEPRFLDYLGTLVTDHRLELLLAGYDEPILAALPRADRQEQIGRMREYLQRRFGVTATGLWLTERVWEPELAADLADAQVGYAFVDDRHFLVSGFRREELHQPWRTESDGKAISLIAIDEQLRYLVPFRPPAETAAYLRQLRHQGHRLAVLADDGEKFGGWPGTREWVYEKGWLDEFFRAMDHLISGGEIRMAGGAEVLATVPSGGLAYLGSASYREMEHWSLPAPAQRALIGLETQLGPERLKEAAGALVRGSHWRNFLAKYAESNRMHKMMVALSGLSRSRGDPPAARRAVGRAQCNDAYWHGVFGGLYLPILRNAIWRQLALAEAELRKGEPLAWETLDLDADGHAEIWVHSHRFSALVSPRRGGAVEVFSSFAAGLNLADALTRRREAYHEEPLPPVDHDIRALLQDRVLPGSLEAVDYGRARYHPQWSWTDRSLSVVHIRPAGDSVEIALRGGGLEKTLTFSADGELRADYAWDGSRFDGAARFATELSLRCDWPVRAEPEGEMWRYPIATVAKSERGLEETEQGVSVTNLWPIGLGRASLVISATQDLQGT